MNIQNAEGQSPERFERFRDSLLYAMVAVCCLLFEYRLFNLGQADLWVPFYYAGDALLTGLPIKGIIDHGWYLENPSLGAPFGHQLYDFPFGEIFYFALFKIMAWFTGSFGVILNVFYLLTFPLTALTSLFTFRRLGFGRGPAIVGSVLFAFQPYHLWRGQAHLFIGTYFLIPLAMLLILRIGADAITLPREKPAPDGETIKPAHPTGAFQGAVALCLLLACSGFYYAFFTGFFLFIVGVLTTLWQRRAGNTVSLPDRDASWWHVAFHFAESGVLEQGRQEPRRYTAFAPGNRVVCLEDGTVPASRRRAPRGATGPCQAVVQQQYATGQ